MERNTTKNLKIFVVEDDPFYGELLVYHLSLNPDYEVIKFTSAKDFLQHLSESPHIVTLDYTLPDMNGEKVLKKIHDFNPDIHVIIISGQEDIKTALALLKKGAYDYIVKDDDTKDVLWNSVNHIRKKIELQIENESLRQELKRKYNFQSTIIGHSKPMQAVFHKIDKAIKSNITVSVTGETGTGKELVAKAIHYGSIRADKPFVAINVAAIPSELLESELFGHEKGAFTGAVTRRVGKFEEANGGTLFLDEISELDLNLQVKLLRVLQEKEITRIGSNQVIKIDPRIIVATHQNLADEVSKGRFRQDLYYRLLGLPIEIPPLRYRDHDIILITNHIITEFCDQNSISEKKISRAAKEKLMGYDFPGNVRELRAVIELAIVMSEAETIEVDDLQFTPTSKELDSIGRTEAPLKEYIRKIVQYYLDKYDHDVLLVAKKLNIGKSTIYNMIKNKELTTK